MPDLLQQFEEEICCYKCKQCGLSLRGSENLDNQTKSHHQEEPNQPSQAQIFPSLGDYLSSIEKKLDICTDLVTKQAVTIAKLLSLHEVNPIESNRTRAPIIDIEEDLTVRHHLKCDQCDFETDNNSQLNLHKSGKHSNQPDTSQPNMAHCPLCSFCNTSQDSVIKHIEDHHPETFNCNKCDHGFMSKGELDNHIANVHKEANPNPASWHSQNNFNCDKCKNTFTSGVNLHKHVTQVHVSKEKVKNTLLVGESNTKYQNPRLIEKALGGRGLFTPGAVKPRTGRAYCSSKDWPNSRFPDNNLEDKVMEHLAIREHSHLIFGAPGNNISNVGDIQDISKKHRLATKSSENCIRIAEKALRDFPPTGNMFEGLN